jgi:hypothetical protein
MGAMRRYADQVSVPQSHKSAIKTPKHSHATPTLNSTVWPCVILSLQQPSTAIYRFLDRIGNISQNGVLTMQSVEEKMAVEEYEQPDRGLSRLQPAH